MRLLSFTLLTITLTLVLMTPTRITAAAADPAGIIQTVLERINVKDVEGALAYFADDAVVRTPAAGTERVSTGKAQIRMWLHDDTAVNLRAELVSIQVSGDTALFRSKVSSDTFRRLRVDPIETTNEVVMRDGKIISLTARLTPESLAKLQAAVTSTLPQTGDVPLSAYAGWAVLASLTVIGCGMAVRRRLTRRS